MSDEVQPVAGDQLTAAQVYEIWRIRDVVFAVEQQCDEPDVDGRDLDPGTTHFWTAAGGVITSYLRSYVADDGVRRIGRVCTLREWRGQGLSGRLLTAAHDRWPGETIQIGAQAYLETWYASFGYRRCGENFWEAGIEHVPMRRP